MLWTLIIRVGKNFLQIFCYFERSNLTREKVEDSVKTKGRSARYPFLSGTKILIFDQNFDCWPKFWFLTKILIIDQNLFFDQNFDFWPKFVFWPKFSFSLIWIEKRSKLRSKETVQMRRTHFYPVILQLFTGCKMFNVIEKITFASFKIINFYEWKNRNSPKRNRRRELNTWSTKTIIRYWMENLVSNSCMDHPIFRVRIP